MRRGLGTRVARTGQLTRTGLAILVVALVLAPRAAGATELVVSCGSDPNDVFNAYSAYGIYATADCPGTGLLLQANATFKAGQGAIWQANAPSGLLIESAWVTSGSVRVRQRQQWRIRR